jgi:hypothetical protein
MYITKVPRHSQNPHGVGVGKIVSEGGDRGRDEDSILDVEI